MSPEMTIFPFIIIVIQWILRVRIVPKDADKMSDTDGVKLYYAGGIIIPAIAITAILTIDITDNDSMKWLWLIIIVIGFGYNSFLYWKYIRESNEHIASLVTLIVGVVYILIFVF